MKVGQGPSFLWLTLLNSKQFVKKFLHLSDLRFHRGRAVGVRALLVEQNADILLRAHVKLIESKRLFGSLEIWSKRSD